MKIHIKARLNVPPGQMFYGGTNPPLLTKVGEVEVSVKTPEDFNVLTKGFFSIGNVLCKIESYDPASNTAFLQGHVQSTDGAYIRALVLEGWAKNKAAFQRYGIQDLQ